MTNPFDFVESLSYSKKNLMDDPENIKSYSPFMINRALSYFQQTIFLANEMNKYSFLDNDIQYRFYFEAVPKKKRFASWAKREKSSELIVLISRAYECSIEKAEEIQKLLNKEQIKSIKDSFIEGGSKKR